jgi:hypothetical protein
VTFSDRLFGAIIFKHNAAAPLLNPIAFFYINLSSAQHIILLFSSIKNRLAFPMAGSGRIFVGVTKMLRHWGITAVYTAKKTLLNLRIDWKLLVSGKQNSIPGPGIIF